MVDHRQVESARRRIAELEGFYIHLAVFVAVLLLLTAVNVYTGDPWWVQWVLFGWGIGIAAHAFAVYGTKPRRIVDWERRKFRELARR